MSWDVVFKKLKPYLVRVETQDGSGTGFFFSRSPSGELCAIATAAHVIEHAHDWKQPIKLVHESTGAVAFVAEDERVVLLDKERDVATILIKEGAIELPNDPLPIVDPSEFYSVGIELAWAGYASIAHPKLCFFSGRVSAFLFERDCYLIDGVAINGVSGGPVFCEMPNGEFEIAGLISAYLPNRSGSTPGLLSAQDITPLADNLKTLRSMHEAKETERSRDQKASTSPVQNSVTEANAVDGKSTS